MVIEFKVKDIIIVGGGGHAKVIINILKKNREFNILGYVDIENNGSILGVDYIGNDDVFIDDSSNSNLGLCIGIGKVDSSDRRRKIIEKIKKKCFYWPPIISLNAIINEEVNVGKGSQIFDGVIINCSTEIQEFCIINTNSTIEHDCIIGKYSHIAPGVTISGGVSVGTNVLVGAGAIIIQNINICNDVVIGAGSVIIKNITEPGTYIGNPLRKIK